MEPIQERLEIYKIFVTTITANEGRRQRAATVYLGMIAGLVAAVQAIPTLTYAGSAAIVFVIAAVWLLTIYYFRRLAQAKFAVIKEIEKDLSFRAFEFEERSFKQRRGVPAPSLTWLEMGLPALLLIGSALLLLCRL